MESIAFDPITALSLDRRRPSGLFTVADTATLGIPRRDVNRFARQGAISRVGPGAFTLAKRWDGMSLEGKHVLRAQAQMLRLGPSTLLSHHAAASLHGLPLLWPPHSPNRDRRIHLVRAGPGPTRTTAQHTVHEQYGSNQQGQPIDGIASVRPVLAALGVAEIDGFVGGVVALDAALHSGKATLEEAHEWLERLRRRPHTSTITRVVNAADGASESPLESQARLVLRALGYRMSLQVVLRTDNGEFVARVDGLIEDLGVVVEVDGRGKYADDSGRGSVEALLSEKHRESAICELGYAVVRVDHPMLQSPSQVDERIRAARVRVRRDRLPCLGPATAS